MHAAFSRILVLEASLAAAQVTPASQAVGQHFTAIQVPTDMVERVQAITVGLIWHIYCNYCSGVPHHFAAQAAVACGKHVRQAAKLPFAAANEAKHSFSDSLIGRDRLAPPPPPLAALAALPTPSPPPMPELDKAF